MKTNQGLNKMRKATVADFKVGAKLVCPFEGWSVTLLRKEQTGIWTGRTGGGDKCVFETEAACYQVAE